MQALTVMPNKQE